MQANVTQTRDYREIATERLQQAVARGQAQSVSLFETIQEQFPVDYLASTRSLSFEVDKGRGSNGPEIFLGFKSSDGEDLDFRFHRNGIRQLVGRAESLLGLKQIDAALDLGGMVKTEEDRVRAIEAHQLVADNLNRVFNKIVERERVLIRTVKTPSGSEVRAVLSDSYRRLDSREIFDGFTNATLGDAGAVVVGGYANDLRWSLRVIRPRVIDTGSDLYVVGSEIRTSDFGLSPVVMSEFVLRLLCINGLVGEKMVNERHLGRQLPDDIKLSERTMKLDTEATKSLIIDVAHTVLSDERRAKVQNEIQIANNKRLEDPDKLFDGLQKKGVISKETAAQAKEHFASAENEMLPPGRTYNRAAQVLGLLARNAELDLRIELEDAAGKVMKAASGV